MRKKWFLNPIDGVGFLPVLILVIVGLIVAWPALTSLIGVLIRV